MHTILLPHDLRMLHANMVLAFEEQWPTDTRKETEEHDKHERQVAEIKAR